MSLCVFGSCVTLTIPSWVPSTLTAVGRFPGHAYSKIVAGAEDGDCNRTAFCLSLLYDIPTPSGLACERGIFRSKFRDNDLQQLSGVLAVHTTT